MSMLIPNNFPKMHAPQDWIALTEVYGRPGGGHGPNTTSIITYGQNEAIQWISNDDYSAPMWSAPLVRGKWIDIVFHYKMSQDPNVGFREQWTNTGTGWKKSVFKDGSMRKYYATMDHTNNAEPNVTKIHLYHKKGAFPSAMMYFGEHKLGTSFEAVAPKSY